MKKTLILILLSLMTLTAMPSQQKNVSFYLVAPVGIISGKYVKLFEEFVQELNESQQKLDFFRSIGIAPDNQPSTSKYMLAVLKPGKNFVDFSGNWTDGPYYLKYKGNERSFYTFTKINATTFQEEGTVDIQRGRLTDLRCAYGIKEPDNQ